MKAVKMFQQSLNTVSIHWTLYNPGIYLHILKLLKNEVKNFREAEILKL